MTHPWPNHDEPACHQCAVLGRCLAQVPQLPPDNFDWPTTHGYITGGVLPDGHVSTPPRVARQVCARLIAWVRWPGNQHRVVTVAGGETRYRHPLDGTPVAGWRPASVAGGCPDCYGRETAVAGCSACVGTGTAIIWPALAEIAAYLDMSGPLMDFAHERGMLCPVCQNDDTEHLRPPIGVIGPIQETPCDWPLSDCIKVAGDLARSLGHPVDEPEYDDDGNIVTLAWKDDPGLWAEVHAWREPEDGRVVEHWPEPSRRTRIQRAMELVQGGVVDFDDLFAAPADNPLEP